MDDAQWVSKENLGGSAKWLDTESTVPVLDGVPIDKWADMSPEWRKEHGLPPTSAYRQTIEEDLKKKEEFEEERFRPPSWRRYVT